MDDGTHPTSTIRPTIRSASDEAAGTNAPKGYSIRNPSEEHAPKIARGPGQQSKPWPPKLTATSNGQSFDRALNQRHDEGGSRAMARGDALTSGYGAAFSEAAAFMNQAVERQNEMMSSMLQARGPLDIVTAANRYLLGGWLAFFEVNVRVAQAASRLTEDAKHSPARPGA
jgi:hypothetical protein